MLFTTHALVGAALGSAVGNPTGAFLAGIPLHHVLDWIPHNDPGSFFYGKEEPKDMVPSQWFMAFLDVIMGVGFVSLLFVTVKHDPAMIAGALGGVISDLADNVPYIKTLFRKFSVGKVFHAFHGKYHQTLPWRKAWFGIGFQVFLGIISVTLLLV